MNYFDFHIHPTLKSTFKEGIPFDAKIPTNAVSGIAGLCSDLPQIVASQASVPQLQKFEKKVLGVALYSVEAVISGDKLLQQIARTNKNLSKYISIDRLKEMENNTIKAYDYIKNILLPPYQNQPQFNILRKGSTLADADPQKIHVFFSLEGCHSLCNSSNIFFDTTEIITNLKDLCSAIPLVSVNLTHLQKSNICNPAFGIQLTDNAAFIPSGNGITADGERLAQACFDLNLCVDVKHMSLVARRQLFQQVASGKYSNPQPVICTHAGFTGIASNAMHEYVLAFEQKSSSVKVLHGKPNHVAPNENDLRRPAPTFNASSINLYDEEIAAIIKGGGLIGLSFDRRICGFVNQFDADPYAFFHDETFLVDKESFSLAEFQQLGITKNNIGSKISERFCNTKDDLLQASDLPSTLQEFHRTQIMLHLKHYLQVCINNGIALTEAQKGICIGSDFDGIINPFYCCMTVEDFPKLKTYLQKNFHDFLGKYTDSKAWRNNLDIKQFTEQFFYLNGEAFLQKRLSLLKSNQPSA